MKKLFLTLCLLASSAHATTTFIQEASIVAGTCGPGENICQLTFSPAVVAGHAITIQTAINAGGASITSVSSDVGGTAGWVIDTGCVQHDATNLVDQGCAYNLNASAFTTVTVNFSANITQTWGASAREYKGTLGGFAFDKSGIHADTSCTSCAGVALTLTGTNDVIVQQLANTVNVTSISSPYTNRTTGGLANGGNFANSLNTVSGTAPTWTLSPAGAVDASAIALKETTAVSKHCTITLLGAGPC